MSIKVSKPGRRPGPGLLRQIDEFAISRMGGAATLPSTSASASGKGRRIVPVPAPHRHTHSTGRAPRCVGAARSHPLTGRGHHRHRWRAAPSEQPPSHRTAALLCPAALHNRTSVLTHRWVRKLPFHWYKFHPITVISRGRPPELCCWRRLCPSPALVSCSHLLKARQTRCGGGESPMEIGGFV